MSDDFESSDILGNALPVGRGRVTTSTTFSSLFKVSVLGACGLLVLFAFRHGRVIFLRWKERHYKLSMRRRYGIPDHDQRPFNVAYAAARLAQEDSRKNQSRMGLQLPLAAHTVSGVDGRKPRARHNGTADRSTQPTFEYASPSAFGVEPLNESDQGGVMGPRRDETSIKPSPFPVRAPLLPSKAGPSLPRSGQASVPDFVSPTDSLVEESHRPEELDEDTPILQNIRTSKRMADSGDDGDLESNLGNRHDKRRRKVSNRQTKPVAQEEAEDVEMADELSDMPVSRRGKKRDRAEASSTFGGDEDSFIDDQDDDRPIRRRRRRQRQSLISSRGQKRGRDDVPSDSESDADDRRSRGKASRQRHDHSSISDGDVSMNELRVSQDPLCKGRRIGEEWEAHGAQFKVGPDGRRLRKVLVKEDRPKFSMPVDSEHPDRVVSVVAIVETWYNEDEYQIAKDRRELAWQDSGKSSAEPETPNSAPNGLNVSHSRRSLAPHQESLLPPGKELLWTSTSVPSSPIRKSNSFGQSVATNLGLRITSLSQTQPSHVSRRVTSLYASSMVKAELMSPKLHASRSSYSKWEKREIEANAIERLRRKKEEEQTKETEQKKASAPSATKPSPVGGGPSAAASTPLTFAPTTDIKGQSKTAAPSDDFKVPFVPSSSGAQTNGHGKSFSFPPPSAPQPIPTTKSLFNAPASSSPSGIPNFFGTKGSTDAALAGKERKPSLFPSSTSDTSGFSFAPTSTQTTSMSQFPEQARANGTSNSASLFSIPPASSTTPSQPSSSTNANSSPPLFGLKPAEPAKSTAPGAPAATKATEASSSTSKFNFGIPNKPSAAPISTNAAVTSKPVSSIFSFGAPKSSATLAAPSLAAPSSASTTTPSAPQQSGPGSFGSFAPAGSGGNTSSSPPGPQNGGSFSFGNNASAQPAQAFASNNAFSTFNAQPFGSTGTKTFTETPNPFGGNKGAPSAFSSGGTSTLSSGPTKSAFSFGESQPSNAKPNEPTKPAFSFAGAGSAPTSNATAPVSAPMFSFNNSGNAGASAANGAPAAGSAPALNGATVSPFGQTKPVPSAFGFGHPSSTGGSFTFGSTAPKAEKS